MEFTANLPIWLQVANAIKADMATGKQPPGSKLPGGRDLALTYAINPNTAARVYQELEKEGLCETRRGLGTFVTGDEHRIRELRQSMAREALDHCLIALSALGYSREEAIDMLKSEEVHP